MTTSALADAPLTPAASTRELERRWLLASLAVVGYFALLEWRPPERIVAQRASDLAQLALVALASAAALAAARRGVRRARAFWLLIALSNAIWGVAQALWTIDLDALAPSTGMGVADVLFVLATAPLLVALVLRPDRASPGGPRLAFDIAILAVIGLHGYLYFSIGYLGSGPGPLRAEYLQWVHDLGNLDAAVVLAALLYLLYRPAAPWRRCYRQVAAAQLVLHGGSAISSASVMAESYHPGLLDLPWAVPFLWMALASIEWRPPPEPAVSEVGPAWADSRRGSLIAVLALVALPGLHLAQRIAQMQLDAQTARLRDELTLISSALIGALFLMRQLGVLRVLERAEERRREHLRLLFQVNPMPMWVLEPARRRFLDVNEAALELYGYTREAFLAATLDELVATRTDGEPADELDGSQRHATSDGRLLDVEVASHQLTDAAGGVLAAVVDLTERAAAERERARLKLLADEAALEWERTFDSIDAPTLVLDEALRITRSNAAARELAGGAERLEGEPLELLAHAEPWQRGLALARERRAGGKARSATCRDAASGRSWQVSVHALGAKRQIVVAREITSLVLLQESLRRQELTAAMGALLAGVAHEVRNPLFAISATLDAFEARHGDRPELRDVSRRLRAELERLSQLMQELLDYGRPPSSALEPRDLLGVVREAVALCEPVAAQHAARIELRVDGSVGPVAMNRDRLSQVFRNLIENAVQHSSTGVVVEVAPRDGLAVCRVSDDGPGFFVEDLPRVFEPFFTRRRGGTGIGLSIVQRVVDEHGGQVEAANGFGGGGVVTVRLPLAADASAGWRESDEPGPPARGGAKGAG